MIASMVGTGTGLSSFRDNVGVLSITKVGSIQLSFLLSNFSDILCS